MHAIFENFDFFFLKFLKIFDFLKFWRNVLFFITFFLFNFLLIVALYNRRYNETTTTLQETTLKNL